MGGGGLSPIDTLKSLGCVAWFPFAYDGDIYDALGETSLDITDSTRFYWDSERNRMMVKSVDNIRDGNTQVLFPSDTFDVEYTAMGQCQYVSGAESYIYTVYWNDVHRTDSGLLANSESVQDEVWVARTIHKNDNYWPSSLYVNNSVVSNQNINGYIMTQIKANQVLIASNTRYASIGYATVKNLMFFNKALTLEEQLLVEQIVNQIESEQ